MLSRKHNILIARVNTFLEFEEYTTLATPSVREQFPPFAYVSAALRIQVLQAIYIHKKGDSEKALEMFFSHFSKLRKAMQLQDSLIGKLVVLMRLSEVLAVISIISSSENLRPARVNHLTRAEKSFDKVAAREFAMAYQTSVDAGAGAYWRLLSGFPTLNAALGATK